MDTLKKATTILFTIMGIIIIGMIVFVLREVRQMRIEQEQSFLECIKITHYCRHESIMGSYLLPNCQEKLNLELVKWCYDKFVE